MAMYMIRRLRNDDGGETNKLGASMVITLFSGGQRERKYIVEFLFLVFVQVLPLASALFDQDTVVVFRVQD